MDQAVELPLDIDLAGAAQRGAIHAFLRSDVAEDRFDRAEPAAANRAALGRRTWSVSMAERLRRLNRYVSGWFGYFRISRTWGEVLALDQWLRRRVRQCYWKQWKTTAMRRRMLLHLGASPASVHLAAADRRGCWGAVTNGLVQLALSNQYLTAQGVPNLQALWLDYHYPPAPSA